MIPIISSRSVSPPSGDEKTARWHKIAVEALKQSGRTRPMAISPPLSLDELKTAASYLHLNPGPE